MLCTPEALLTPESARAMVRVIGLSTGLPVFDDDLAQEALLRALRAFSRYGSRCIEHPKALFKRIVRDTIYDHWRRRRDLVSLDFIDEHTLTVICCSDDLIDRQRKLAHVFEAISQLNIEQQQLFELYYFEELSVNEIAELIGKSKSAVKMGLLRGRQRILELVSPNSLPRT